ncbi:DUF2630 family protein [Umezawaea sp. Da 62-37]|uniref:DUF2630 family protein n=1 Tax=Umezawaea sp. Da 62-37 TaxID=3075927 RepID=UPI0028F6E8F8|nr:DUF2630 family protein [Umezawaea sp. Da 62-37]WNV90452.1 DUF2630 family protein [Umezawaea sp. Da 62-37]
MTDEEVISRINQLVAEEHELENSKIGEGLSADEATRLRAIEVGLDQAWDLLRQRRARRAAGMDPDAAETRDVGVVEGYRQ